VPASAIPQGHNAVSPYLTVHDARGLIDFLKRTFDAQEMMVMPGPGGAVMHAELRIGDSVVMIGGAAPGGATFAGQVHVYVADVDETYARALRAGATSTRPPTDMFYGDRISMVRDPHGNVWAISTHKEDVSPAEMARRMSAAKQG
jgi:PhnB protein